jgi:hypothetical protein
LRRLAEHDSFVGKVVTSHPSLFQDDSLIQVTGCETGLGDDDVRDPLTMLGPQGV